MSKIYSLHKSRSILRHAYALYKRKAKEMSSATKAEWETLLEKLDHAVLAQNREQADLLARETEAKGEIDFKQSTFEHVWDFLFGLDSGWSLIPTILFALGLALLVRQMWFEPFEIPTGSMRPNFKEQDHLTVTKTAFGINTPMETSHLYFDPNLVQRTSIVIFSGDKLNMRDVDTNFLYVLPYKKRFIKRLIGKPGDTVYFYGGKIYSIDKDGNPNKELLDSPWMQNLEHIPFLAFEGESVVLPPNQILLKQMDQPLGRVVLNGGGSTTGEIFNGKEWNKDDIKAQNEDHSALKTYSDYLGMRNFGTARLLTKQELMDYTNNDLTGLEAAPMYLEIRHDPNLTNPKPRIDTTGKHILLTPYVSVIPLQQKHLDAIMDNMYTARFVVKNGRATRYNVEGPHFDSASPRFNNVPDGTYEFYFGKGKKIGWGAVPYELDKNSPLYSRDPSNIQKLFNLGIDFNTYFDPKSNNQVYFPHRYAYFRDGDLYLLGAPIFKKGDPALEAFNKREAQKEEKATANKPYVAFKDHGAPLKNGEYDRDFIRQMGLTLPEKMYLVLGDNHAMSADSRVFGFVPEDNLQGAPVYILWPPDRLGSPPQKPYPLFTTPRLIIWGIAAIVGLIWYLLHRRNLRKPIFKKVA